jgi:hypothetical protein
MKKTIEKHTSSSKKMVEKRPSVFGESLHSVFSLLTRH